LVIVIRSLPEIVRLFRGDTKIASTTSQPVAKKPAIEEKKQIVETSALAAYKNLIKAIERDDEETARRYINNARWNQMELEEEDPSAIKEVHTRCDVGKKFESEEMDDRAVLTANSHDGQPPSTVLIVKMAMEDEQWKVFSTSCHKRPPSDYMQEARAWLFEQPATFGDDLNSRLIANGLRDGEVSCFMALERENPKAVKKCLETGWSVDAENSDGRKAIDIVLAKMQYASPEENEILQMFVKEGANINRQNHEGMTPLMLAAIYCNADAAKAFIDAGADLDYKTPDGISPSKLAENCPQVTKLLRAARQ
jgi:hypothetical protein